MKASLKACDVVIFGGGGDLAMRKLLPALYHLDMDGLLAPTTQIIGASRREVATEEYQTKKLLLWSQLCRKWLLTCLRP